MRALRVGGDYTFADRWQGVSRLDVQTRHGLNVLDASATGDRRSQPDDPAAFTKVNLDVSRTQPLPRDFSLFVALSG